MSPYSYATGNYIWKVGDFGDMQNNYDINVFHLYPTIAIIPSVTLTNTPNQDGTATHPFEIATS